MKKQITTLAFLLPAAIMLLTIPANAQSFEWAKRMGGTSTDIGYSIALDDSGNIYTTGRFNATVDFDPNNGTFNLTSAGENDIFISKLDALGNFVWTKKMGGVSYDGGLSIVVDASGNVYTTGYFFGTADFDPDSGTFILTSAGDADIFVSKLNALGNFIWAKQMGGVGQNEGTSIAIDFSGNVYTTGYFYGTTDFDPGAGTFILTSVGLSDIFVSKLDSSGNFVWAKQIGGAGGERGSSIAVDVSGNVYSTGYFEGTADFDPGSGTFNLTSKGGLDIFVSKLDASGNLVLAKQMGSNANDFAVSIAVDLVGNVYTTGGFQATTDFDPNSGIFNLTAAGDDIFISKLDTFGNFVWAKQMGGIFTDYGCAIAVDVSGNVYITGNFKGTADFDPGSGTFNCIAAGWEDIFISKLDSAGNFMWAIQMGGALGDYVNSIALDTSGYVYTTGYFKGTADFYPGNGTFNLTSAGYIDIFVHKLLQRGIFGRIYKDISPNCIQDTTEIGIAGRKILITPGNIITETNESGIWSVDSLPAGTYTITADTSGHWILTCPNPQIFTVTNPNDVTAAPSFGFVSTQPCASPEVSVNAPFLRPCFSNQKIYVQACNQNIATGALDSAYIKVQLDSLLTVQSATLAYTAVGNNTYRFNLGNLNPGMCVNFSISCLLSCNAVIGQTLCMQANLYPADSCVFDTISSPYPGGVSACTTPWDHSSLNVEGYCLNDSIFFVITNTGSPGNGDMTCYAPVRIYIDGQLIQRDSIQLAGGDSFVYVFFGDGRTWRLEADQHPLHPGNSHPNATVEACGNIANWTPDLVTILPQDDADPIVDIYCGIVTGSYDPNEKTGYPGGVGITHDVLPNQKMEYVIRFQNTGTDTAFNIIIKDTLDTGLDIFSVVPGVSSHPCYFRMHGPRMLEWTFYNILLPDSNSNEPESHGFVTFSVNQNKNLVNGTEIKNSADIYFDYNAPVITNTTLHTLNDGLDVLVWVIEKSENNFEDKFCVYPNPTTSELTIQLDNNCDKAEVEITNPLGEVLLEKIFVNTNVFNVKMELPPGLYFITLRGDRQQKAMLKVVKE